jgi:hypothetical protein
VNVKKDGNVIELPRVLDSKNGIPLTRQNYIEFNWWNMKEADLDAESLASIPAYLREDEDGKPIPPGKKAKIISIRP